MGRVSKMAEWVPVPEEPGCEFRLRPLSSPELRLAEEAALSQGAEALKRLSVIDPQVLKEWQTGDAPEDPLRGLDVDIVLANGLLDCRGPAYDDDSLEVIIPDLSADTARWAATWIAERSRRSLGEAKGSSPSYEPVESPQS